MRSFNPAILKLQDFLKLRSCDPICSSMDQTDSSHHSASHSYLSPHTASTTWGGNPGWRSKRQQRTIFLRQSGGGDGQGSTHERFSTDFRNNLFHHAVFHIFLGMKQTVHLRRKGRKDYVTFELVSRSLGCSVPRRWTGGVGQTWKPLRHMPVLVWSDISSLICCVYVIN